MFNINQLQVWKDGSNIGPLQTITQSSVYDNDVSSNVIDSSLNTWANVNTGLNQYIDLSFNDPISMNTLESVIIYSEILETRNRKN